MIQLQTSLSSVKWSSIAGGQHFDSVESGRWEVQSIGKAEGPGWMIDAKPGVEPSGNTCTDPCWVRRSQMICGLWLQVRFPAMIQIALDTNYDNNSCFLLKLVDAYPKQSFNKDWFFTDSVFR